MFHYFHILYDDVHNKFSRVDYKTINRNILRINGELYTFLFLCLLNYIDKKSESIWMIDNISRILQRA